MIDLSTNYLGLKLKNPVVVSASPLTEKLENFARLEDAGRLGHRDVLADGGADRGGEREHRQCAGVGVNSYAESTSYLPDMQKYHVGPIAIWNCYAKEKLR